MLKIYANRSWAEFALGEYKKTTSDDSIALSFKPRNGLAYWIKASCYEGLKKYDAAVNNIKLAIPYYTNNTDSLFQLYNSLGDDLVKLTKLNDADEAYNHSYSLYPDRLTILSTVTNYIKLENYEEAIKYCDVGIRHNPAFIALMKQ